MLILQPHVTPRFSPVLNVAASLADARRLQREPAGQPPSKRLLISQALIGHL